MQAAVKDDFDRPRARMIMDRCATIWRPNGRHHSKGILWRFVNEIQPKRLLFRNRLGVLFREEVVNFDNLGHQRLDSINDRCRIFFMLNDFRNISSEPCEIIWLGHTALLLTGMECRAFPQRSEQ